jgi:hypothetical protein
VEGTLQIFISGLFTEIQETKKFIQGRGSPRDEKGRGVQSRILNPEDPGANS